MDDQANGGALDDVEAPPECGPDTVAVKVRGDSMYPAYADGDLIYYDQHFADLEAAIGRECVVQLDSGELYLKVVRRGTKKGYFTLYSHNASPIEDVKITWAAPVKWVRKSG